MIQQPTITLEIDRPQIPHRRALTPHDPGLIIKHETPLPFSPTPPHALDPRPSVELEDEVCDEDDGKRHERAEEHGCALRMRHGRVVDREDGSEELDEDDETVAEDADPAPDRAKRASER